MVCYVRFQNLVEYRLQQRRQNVLFGISFGLFIVGRNLDFGRRPAIV